VCIHKKQYLLTQYKVHQAQTKYMHHQATLNLEL
jgi:hypothetical protein